MSIISVISDKYEYFYTKCKLESCPHFIKTSLYEREERKRSIFCSPSCGITWYNLHPEKEFICENPKCTKPERKFYKRQKVAKYCSKTCRDEHYLELGIKPRYGTYLCTKLERIFGNLCHTCSHCKINLYDTYGIKCEVHHVIERKWGGDNNFRFLVYLCPTCHALTKYYKIKEFTTISGHTITFGSFNFYIVESKSKFNVEKVRDAEIAAPRNKKKQLTKAA